MSYVGQNMVLDHSKAKGTARLVLICLARYIKYEQWEMGEWGATDVYPSQSTIAKQCNCSRSSVERALQKLVELGEITPTGETWKRNTVVYRLDLLDDVKEGRATLGQGSGEGSETLPKEGDLTDSGSGQGDHVTQTGSGHSHMTQNGSGHLADPPRVAANDDDLTQIENDLTHSGADLTQIGHHVTQTGSQEGSGDGKPEKDFRHGSSAPSATLDVGLSLPSEIFPSGKKQTHQLAELSEVENDLIRAKLRLSTIGPDRPAALAHAQESVEDLEAEIDAIKRRAVA